MTKIYTEQQQQFIVASRNEFADYCKRIDIAKGDIKFMFESLVSKLGIDPKEDKESVKALKKGFQMYYKESAKQEQGVVDAAVKIAEL